MSSKLVQDFMEVIATHIYIHNEHILSAPYIERTQISPGSMKLDFSVDDVVAPMAILTAEIKARRNGGQLSVLFEGRDSKTGLTVVKGSLSNMAPNALATYLLDGLEAKTKELVASRRAFRPAA